MKYAAVVAVLLVIAFNAAMAVISKNAFFAVEGFGEEQNIKYTLVYQQPKGSGRLYAKERAEFEKFSKHLKNKRCSALFEESRAVKKPTISLRLSNSSKPNDPVTNTTVPWYAFSTDCDDLLNFLKANGVTCYVKCPSAPVQSGSRASSALQAARGS
jgi:hypothetical protein